MKLSEGLFLAFAGLGLFACSNEDVTTDATVDDGKSKTMVISLMVFLKVVVRLLQQKLEMWLH